MINNKKIVKFSEDISLEQKICQIDLEDYFNINIPNLTIDYNSKNIYIHKKSKTYSKSFIYHSSFLNIIIDAINLLTSIYNDELNKEFFINFLNLKLGNRIDLIDNYFNNKISHQKYKFLETGLSKFKDIKSTNYIKRDDQNGYISYDFNFYYRSIVDDESYDYNLNIFQDKHNIYLLNKRNAPAENKKSEIIEYIRNINIDLIEKVRQMKENNKWIILDCFSIMKRKIYFNYYFNDSDSVFLIESNFDQENYNNKNIYVKLLNISEEYGLLYTDIYIELKNILLNNE